MTAAETALWVKSFKYYMSFDQTETDKDTIMEMLLLGVIGDLSTYGIIIGEEVVDEEVTGVSGVAYLPRYPVVSINSLTVDSVVIDPTTIKINKNILKADSLDGDIVTNLTLGWTFATVPADIKIAVLKFSEKLYNDAVMEREGLSVVSNDIKQRASYRSEIPEFSLSIINKYSVLSL